MEPEGMTMENLDLGPGGETGPANDLSRSSTERIGANIILASGVERR